MKNKLRVMLDANCLNYRFALMSTGANVNIAVPGESDLRLLDFSRAHDAIIVTKDRDFIGWPGVPVVVIKNIPPPIKPLLKEALWMAVNRKQTVIIDGEPRFYQIPIDRPGKIWTIGEVVSRDTP